MEGLSNSILCKLDDQSILNYEKELLNMDKKLKDFNSKILKMTDSLEHIEIENGLSYLDGKNLLLGLYMKTITEFIKNKVSGEYSDNQIKNLLMMKLIQDKFKVIDNKIENQMSKHYRIADEGRTNVEENIKSNILSLKEEKVDKKVTTEKKSKYKNADESKYQANKSYFDFTETKTEKKERQKKLEKAKQKLKDTEFYNEMLDEMDDRPEEFRGENDTHYGRYMKEVEKYEEDMLHKVNVSKKKIKQLKKKDRKDDDINNFAAELKNIEKVINNISN
jgi:hypothetical protein